VFLSILIIVINLDSTCKEATGLVFMYWLKKNRNSCIGLVFSCPIVLLLLNFMFFNYIT
jgi:hypothetical protein